MIWTNLQNNFMDEGKIYIDAWLTSDENEEGKVIAKVYKNENAEVVVDYIDKRAKTDSMAQELIQETIKDLEALTYIMVWIEEEEKWYYFMDDFNKEQFTNGYVDYTIEVHNGIILTDNFKADTIGKQFSDYYKEDYWNLNINE